MREHLDEESASKEDILRQLNKAQGEADMWRQKFETDGLAKAEELEMSKMKLQARLTEAQGTIEQLNAKLGQLDKAKGKLQAEIDEMAAQADQAHILNNSKRRPSSLTRLYLNGSKRLILLEWTWMLHRRSVGMLLLTCSE